MGKAKKGGKVAKLPKKECCVSKTRCNRCPLRMLKEGTLPAGYTVKQRRLVRLEDVAVVQRDQPVAVGTKTKKTKKAKKAKKAKKKDAAVAVLAAQPKKSKKSKKSKKAA